MQSRNPITTPRVWWDVIQPTLDAAAVMASLAVVKWLSGRGVDDISLAMGLIATVLFLLVSQLTGFHRRSEIGTPDREMSSLAATWTLTFMGLALLAFATRHGQHFARSVMCAWFVTAPAMVGLGRMSLRIVQYALLRRGVGIRRVAIAGLNELGIQTFTNISKDASLGLRAIGFYDDRQEKRVVESEESVPGGEPDSNLDTTVPDGQQHELAGGLPELVELARRGEVDTVLITLPMRAEDRIRYLLDQLSDSTVSVYIVPDFFVFELLHSKWTNMGGLPAVSVFENPLFGIDGMMKRVSDLVIATLALVAAAIPMLLIALAIKLTSSGPVFFRQRRYGLDGREILVWKFRSMRTCDNGPVVKQATKDDPRITRIGGILRKTSLDELPQLFNVIEGSMSLVGPRPHAAAHNEEYRGLIRGYMLRHKVKPGITGLAQVNGCRGETETLDKMQRRVEWDHRYIRTWSLKMDLKIMIRTLLVVWKQDEAY